MRSCHVGSALCHLKRAASAPCSKAFFLEEARNSAATLSPSTPQVPFGIYRTVSFTHRALPPPLPSADSQTTLLQARDDGNGFSFLCRRETGSWKQDSRLNPNGASRWTTRSLFSLRHFSSERQRGLAQKNATCAENAVSPRWYETFQDMPRDGYEIS